MGYSRMVRRYNVMKGGYQMEKAQFKKVGQEQEEEQEQEQETEQPQQPVKKLAAISLVQVPSQYELAFQTPKGVMNPNEYLVWLGNLILELKRGITG